MRSRDNVISIVICKLIMCFIHVNIVFLQTGGDLIRKGREIFIQVLSMQVLSY